jgi:hypothetical protein
VEDFDCGFSGVPEFDAEIGIRIVESVLCFAREDFRSVQRSDGFEFLKKLLRTCCLEAVDEVS